MKQGTEEDVAAEVEIAFIKAFVRHGHQSRYLSLLKLPSRAARKKFLSLITTTMERDLDERFIVFQRNAWACDPQDILLRMQRVGARAEEDCQLISRRDEKDRHRVSLVKALDDILYTYIGEVLICRTIEVVLFCAETSTYVLAKKK